MCHFYIRADARPEEDTISPSFDVSQLDRARYRHDCFAPSMDYWHADRMSMMRFRYSDIFFRYFTAI